MIQFIPSIGIPNTKSMRVTKIVPAQLRAARALAGWNRVKCSKITGISADTIKSIEYGISKPNRTTVEKLAIGFSESGIFFIEYEQTIGVLQTLAAIPRARKIS